MTYPTPPLPPELHGPGVVGIDTGLTKNGLSWLGWDGPPIPAVTMGREKLTTLPLHDRVPSIDALAFEVVVSATARGIPRLVLIESPDTSRSYGGLVERVTLCWRVTGSLMSLGVRVGWVPSPVLKGYCIGKGGGTAQVDGVQLKAKLAVKATAQRLWPECQIADDNQADATVLAAMALDVLGGERRVPDAHAEQWLHRDSIEYPPSVRAAR